MSADGRVKIDTDLVSVNGWRVQKPADMILYTATHQYPGDYDQLLYRGFTISTFENGRTVDGVYTGPFFVHGGGDAELKADTLEIAREWINTEANK